MMQVVRGISVALVVLVACTAEASSGIGGSLTYYGGPVPGVHREAAGKIVVLDEEGEEVARQSVREGDGFGFKLTPGSYRLVGSSGDASCKDVLLTLSDGQYVDLEIACRVK